jgi:hypothetical protein
MAASNTRFTQNSLGQSKTPIDSDHGIYRDLRNDERRSRLLALEISIIWRSAANRCGTAGADPADER